MDKLTQQYRSQNFTETRLATDLSSNLIYREISGASYECYCPAELDHFIIMLVENRDEINDVNGINHTMSPLQMQLYFPGQILCNQLKSTTIIYEISISQKIFERISDCFKHPLSVHKKYPTIELDLETFYKLVHELKCIGDEIKSGNGLWEVIYSRLRITSLIISGELLKILPESQNNNTQVPLLKKFIDLVGQHCMDTRKVSFYANSLFVSANYLNILCRKHYNRTASSVIADDFIQTIKNHLVSNKKSIKEIAIDLKFCDTASFSNFFKKHTGMSPKIFRNQK
ncbi:helix-turn-helix transcriptional regulator [Pedobacter sp. HDW13]|uniref:helix-turn-helix domain-containing protein n=1 Tax=Pedobacter sp. HDW13 TaxID=2714940 RepID=UPI001409C66D|nr:helix-turn-helix transcriptional regulator [Pedobacter sp. HDW13]QIL41199.1 helix-turn-helix transcriptional regulator [Pedobacter sp. HDW13]